MIRYLQTLILALLVLFLSACQALAPEVDKLLLDPESLAVLQPATLPRQRTHPEPVSVDRVIAHYSELIPLLEDPETKIRALHRLADLKLNKTEVLMAEQAVDELDIAIEAYQDLLATYPDRPNNDQILYQLAKTYDLKGQADLHLATLTRLVQEFPESEYITEVQFRRGEILFSQSRYPQAQVAFQAVIDRGESVFLANAYYMKGWSLFKQQQYEPALRSYTAVLDRVLPEGEGLENVDTKHQTMVEDLFRVMGLSFSYLGGAESLEKLFVSIGEKPYETIVYERYSQLLLDKEQYSDALAVFENYIARHPLSRWAPHYQVRIIQTLQQAGFNSDVVQEKIRFVDEYGRNSIYWQEHENRDLSFVREQLQLLLPELANRHYVKAQKAAKAESTELKKDEFALAARYYKDFVELFPQHPDAAESTVLLAESYMQLEKWPEAIAAFNRAGYEYPDYEAASEAAYGSIIAYQNFAETWEALSKEVITERESQQQENRLHFVDYHSEDARAIDVLYVSLQHDYDNKQYNYALQLAKRLLEWQPPAQARLILETTLIKAHSLYALEDYMRAEQAYDRVLTLMPQTDKRYKGLVENLAASVFKQAEQRLAAGDKRSAVNEFLRVGQAAPGAKLRASAEFDAVGYLIELKDWSKSIEVMSAFRLRYPNHPKIDTLVPKMALAYRETEQWENAADELKTLFELAETEQEKQDTLLIAAELYDRAKNYDKAILSYRKYANTYPEPVDQYMETANRLAELYEETDKPLKRRFWLSKQMKTVDQLGDKADDRMRYLAAAASAVLAEDAFNRYKQIKLTLPLNESMQAKTAALEKAMQAYQKTASYGVSSFSTEAGYRMADIYAQLSRDLMDSDRPEGLNALELDQYEILLEEQAFPFEDNAIDIHEQNASRSWQGIYDEWVQDSFEALASLLPGRYDKPEAMTEWVDALQ